MAHCTDLITKTVVDGFNAKRNANNQLMNVRAPKALYFSVMRTGRTGRWHPISTFLIGLLHVNNLQIKKYKSNPRN